MYRYCLLNALAALCTFPLLKADPLPYTYSGNTTGAPTYTSHQGFTGPYTTFEFTVTQTAIYGFEQNDTGFSPVESLYKISFDPASPGTNLMDERNGPGGDSTSPLSEQLMAGTVYILVNSGTDPTQFGAFTETITGPVDARLTPVGAVPEPTGVFLFATVVAASALLMKRKQGRAVRPR